MKIAITGAAGFIGSNLAERALSDNHEVHGIDCFTDYYPKQYKQDNVQTCLRHKRFTFHNADITKDDLKSLFKGIDIIFHLAAQAGVRASWGDHFRVYSDTNVLGTQRVLEAARIVGVERLVYASSSSVYGDVNEFPMRENACPKPVSPYGVSKLAGEHLCQLYNLNYGISTVSLRYFTVYGPRQRPDMAFHKFIRASLRNEQPVLYGNGDQTRDFTFVSDAVEATYNAGMLSDVKPGVYNIGGGSRISVNEVFRFMEDILGRPVQPLRVEIQKGDVRHTAADISAAVAELGYAPKIAFRDGLTKEIEWLKSICNGGIYGY
jgi:nucleoside-diphosphate-sugar epimerase